MWKPNQPKLYDKSGSIGRLKNLVTKLRKDLKLLEQYDQQIHKYFEEGIIEKAPGDIKCKEFYLPHKAVVKENAETTKVRIVYDASAKPEGSPSLNECLETCPPLQNLPRKILVRIIMRPVVITGDMKQAFLQICIKEEERDALRFH